MSPRRLVSLYPAPWRHRYGEEFLLLLEDHPPRGLQLVDIVWGAIDARLFPQAPEGRFRMFTRIAGFAALTAAVLLALGVFSVGIEPLELNAIRISLIYTMWLIGLAGIHLRQVPARPGLAWIGFLAALAGFASGVIGFVLSNAGVLPLSGGEYGFVSGIALWVGSVVLGATMLAIRVFPALVGLLLTISAPLAMLGLVVQRAEASAEVLGVLSLVGIFLYGVAWAGVGVSLLRVQPKEGVLEAVI